MLLHFDSLGYKNWASEIRHILAVNCFGMSGKIRGSKMKKHLCEFLNKELRINFCKFGKHKLAAIVNYHFMPVLNFIIVWKAILIF